MLVDVAARKVGRALATVPEDHGVDQMRFNDGKGAPGGALIVGRMHAAWRTANPGRLYRCAWRVHACMQDMPSLSRSPVTHVSSGNCRHP